MTSTQYVITFGLNLMNTMFYCLTTQKLGHTGQTQFMGQPVQAKGSRLKFKLSNKIEILCIRRQKMGHSGQTLVVGHPVQENY